MKASQLLKELDFGNSVAEFDEQLDAYFVETQIYSDFIDGRYDIVSGDKGTGKTAIYRIVRDKHREIPQLSDVELIAGFNDAGNPVFQRLSQSEQLQEGEYITVWKSYITSLLGNYILNIFEGCHTPKMAELDHVLTAVGLRSKDATASTIFSQLTNLLRSFGKPNKASIKFSVTESGLPVVAPTIDFSTVETHDEGAQVIVNSDDAMNLLNETIKEAETKIWLVLDRLDEAFAGYSQIEVPVLRALFRVYLDMQAHSNIKLKLFVRNDLFRKVVRGGFVNLTHVNARRIQIKWHPDDLYALLCRRIRERPEFMQAYGGNLIEADLDLFTKVFPAQVDIGKKNPTAWNWILGRIRDGNGIAPPRNLIDFVNKAKEVQARREERDPREFNCSMALIEAESLRRALSELSEQRVQDTLLAESGEYAAVIAGFKNGKAEHNMESLLAIIQSDSTKPQDIIEELEAIGFLEKTGSTYKVPMLYRSGLRITQGKAFSSEEAAEDE
jgi:hypothetical protein